MQSEFDDVKAMAEAVEQLGDEPPVIEPTPDPAEAPPSADVVAVPQADPQAEDVKVGGLGEPLEQPEEESLSIDKLLGLDKPRGKEPPEQDTQADEPAVKDKPDPAPGSVEERMAEMAGQMRVLREDNDRLTQRQLTQEPTTTKEEDLPELESDVLEYLGPYVERLADKKVAERLDKLEKAFEPVLNQTHNAQLAHTIGRHVEGFKPEDIDTLYTALEDKSMSAQDEALYRDGVSGAILLAKELQSRGALAGGKKTRQQPNLLASRHHSESTGAAPANQDDLSEEEKVRKLMATDPAIIRNMVDSLE